MKKALEDAPLTALSCFSNEYTSEEQKIFTIPYKGRGIHPFTIF